MAFKRHFGTRAECIHCLLDHSNGDGRRPTCKRKYDTVWNISSEKMQNYFPTRQNGNLFRNALLFPTICTNRDLLCEGGGRRSGAEIQPAAAQKFQFQQNVTLNSELFPPEQRENGIFARHAVYFNCSSSLPVPSQPSPQY